AAILTRARLRVLMPRLPLAPVLARSLLRSSLALGFGCSCLASHSLRSSLVPCCDPHSRSASGAHASPPTRSGPRSFLAAILTRARLRVLMPRLPLAPVLARSLLRSSLALGFGCSCLASHSLRSSLVPCCDPHSRSASGAHASPPTRSGPRSFLAAILTRARLRVLMPRLPLAPVLARSLLRSSLALGFGCSCLASHSLRSSLVPCCDPHSRSASGAHASPPTRCGPRSFLAAILTRARLRVLMPRLPLAPVLARSLLGSSLALGFGCSSRHCPVIVILLVADHCRPLGRERPCDLCRDRAVGQPRLLSDGVGDLPGAALDHAQGRVNHLVVLDVTAPGLRFDPNDHQLAGLERRFTLHSRDHVFVVQVAVTEVESDQ